MQDKALQHNPSNYLAELLACCKTHCQLRYWQARNRLGNELPIDLTGSYRLGGLHTRVSYKISIPFLLPARSPSSPQFSTLVEQGVLVPAPTCVCMCVLMFYPRPLLWLSVLIGSCFYGYGSSWGPRKSSWMVELAASAASDTCPSGSSRNLTGRLCASE